MPGGFTENAFLDAFSVVLCNAFYLPKAGRFALLPPLLGVQRTGDEAACILDYNPETDTVTLTAQKNYRCCVISEKLATFIDSRKGDHVRVFDGRPNLELFLATGRVERENPSDFLTLEFELVPADRLYSAKRQVLESLGYQQKETFRIYQERIPSQLLSFLRLSRIQDVNQLTQVSHTQKTRP